MGRDGEKEVCLMSYMIENILIVTINRNPSHFANPSSSFITYHKYICDISQYHVKEKECVIL